MKIVIPMAGEGSRFSKAGYEKPKPFIDILGKSMIERVMDNLACEDAQYILIGRKAHLEKEKKIVQKIIERYNAVFISIDQLTEGTACTVLFAREYINNDEPLLIANSDQIVDVSISAFVKDCLQKKLDGSILTFIDQERNPKWSFVKINDSGHAIQVREKEAISNIATVGIYLFSKGNFFVDSAIDMIINNDRVNNEFYTCPVYNYMIADSKKVGTYNIEQSQMHGIGTPEDLDLYLKRIA